MTTTIIISLIGYAVLIYMHSITYRTSNRWRADYHNAEQKRFEFQVVMEQILCAANSSREAISDADLERAMGDIQFIRESAYEATGTMMFDPSPSQESADEK